MRRLRVLPLLLSFAVFLTLVVLPILALNGKTAETQYVVLKCSFHTHTNASDGGYSPTQVVTLYKNASYDCIAITDHDTTAGYNEAYYAGLQQDLLVICGEELTCHFTGGYGHVLGLFLNGTIPFNATRKPLSEFFGLIHAQNGLGIAAHPAYDNGQTKSWLPYQNATFINGWEWNVTWSSQTWIRQWAFHESGKIFMMNHDFHGGPVPTDYYTLVLAHNRTVEGVREALDSKRTVLYVFGFFYGAPESLACLVQSKGWDRIRK